jgi:virulence-associated protein VapD
MPVIKVTLMEQGIYVETIQGSILIPKEFVEKLQLLLDYEEASKQIEFLKSTIRQLENI